MVCSWRNEHEIRNDGDAQDHGEMNVEKMTVLITPTKIGMFVFHFLM